MIPESFGWHLIARALDTFDRSYHLPTLGPDDYMLVVVTALRTVPAFFVTAQYVQYAGCSVSVPLYERKAA